MDGKPTADEQEELLFSARFGEIDDVKAFVDTYGAASLADSRDESGNTILHMTCANGHQDILVYLLPLVPASLLSVQNASGSTPLHWAALNEQLDVMKTLVSHSNGPGPKLVDIKNNAGRTPLGEAEMAGWDAGATWLVSVMDFGGGKEGDARMEEEELTNQVVDDADVVEGTEPPGDHVEVRDGLSRMTIKSDAASVPKDAPATPGS